MNLNQIRPDLTARYRHRKTGCLCRVVKEYEYVQRLVQIKITDSSEIQLVTEIKFWNEWLHESLVAMK